MNCSETLKMETYESSNDKLTPYYIFILINSDIYLYIKEVKRLPF